MYLAVMSELNYDGQEKVIEYAIDLLKIPEYKRITSKENTNAEE